MAQALGFYPMCGRGCQNAQKHPGAQAQSFSCKPAQSSEQLREDQNHTVRGGTVRPGRGYLLQELLQVARRHRQRSAANDGAGRGAEQTHVALQEDAQARWVPLGVARRW